MQKLSSLLTRRSFSPAICYLLVMTGAATPGCSFLGYKEWFPSNNIRVIYTEQQCRDVDESATTRFENADHIYTTNWGISRFYSTNENWDIIARQLAAELDGDLTLISPCDKYSRTSFENKQLDVWRTHGYKPQIVEEYRPDSGTLIPPSGSTNGSRLTDIFECFEQARVTTGPISPENMKRLENTNATEFFAPGPYFSAYMRVDKHFRPTRTGDLSLSMIYSDRAKAAWAADYYRKLPVDEKQLFADRHLLCLINRGYQIPSNR